MFRGRWRKHRQFWSFESLSLGDQARLPGREDICELELEGGVRWETVPDRESRMCYAISGEEKIYFAPVRN